MDVGMMWIKPSRSGKQPEAARNKIQHKQQEGGHPKDKVSEKGPEEGRKMLIVCGCPVGGVTYPIPDQLCAKPWANGKPTNVACGNGSQPGSFTSTHDLFVVSWASVVWMQGDAQSL